jgi:hypothetical protein
MTIETTRAFPNQGVTADAMTMKKMKMAMRK